MTKRGLSKQQLWNPTGNVFAAPQLAAKSCKYCVLATLRGGSCLIRCRSAAGRGAATSGLRTFAAGPLTAGVLFVESKNSSVSKSPFWLRYTIWRWRRERETCPGKGVGLGGTERKRWVSSAGKAGGWRCPSSGDVSGSCVAKLGCAVVGALGSRLPVCSLSYTGSSVREGGQAGQELCRSWGGGCSTQFCGILGTSRVSAGGLRLFLTGPAPLMRSSVRTPFLSPSQDS